MPWAFVRPSDPTLLERRPLLDLGCGDAQTVLALADPSAIGIDRSIDVLHLARRSGLLRVACATADALPFRPGTFAVVLAADLFHHVPDDHLAGVLREVRAALREDGRLVAWWYEVAAHPAPDAPRYPRTEQAVVSALTGAGFSNVGTLTPDTTAGGGPPTVGVVAAP